MRNLKKIYILLGMFVSSLYANGVSGAVSPGIANPARAATAVSEELKTQGSGMLQSSTEIFGKPGQALPAEMSGLTFRLKSFNIVQSHRRKPVFSAQELTEPFSDKIGCTISLGTLKEMVNQMSTRYQKAGFVLTKIIIPPQRIKNGVVTLQVIEGYIDKVEVSGDIDPCLKEFLMCYAEQIRCSVPLEMKVLERYTLLANDVHGVNLKVLLKPSPDTPGASDLIFVTEQKWGNAFCAGNNFGTRYLGPFQIMSAVEVDSYFRAGDVTQFQAVSTVNKQLNFAELRHVEWLNHNGLKGTMFGQYLRTIPGSLLAPFDVMGNYQLATAELSYALIRSREKNVLLNSGFSVLDSKSSILGEELYYDHIRPIFLEILYNNQDTFKGVNQAELMVTQGLRILSASGNTKISRPQGHSVFTKLNSTVSRIQTITDLLSVYAMVQGQYAFQPLLVPSQFGFGGSVVGRGYDPSEIIGNNGVAGVFEARYQGPSFSKHVNMQTYVFYDAGRVWNPKYRDSATSAGIGIRAKIFKDGEIGFYVAKSITHDVIAYGNRRVRAFCSFIVRK